MSHADRERTVARRVAIGLVVVFVALWIVRLFLGIATGSLTDQSSLAFDLVFDAGAIVFSTLILLVGWAIVTRQPKNTIGWLLMMIPILGIFGFVVGDYATEALVNHPGGLPFGRVAAWFDRWLIVAVLAIFIPLFLLFPDGKLPSRRWRPVLWFTIASTTITVIGFAVTPGRLTGAFSDLTSVTVTNPLGIDAFAGAIDGITQIAGFGILISAFLAGAAIIVRFRGASGEVRQQIKWLAFVGVAFMVEFVIGIVLSAILGDRSSAADSLGNVLFAVWFVTLLGGIPIACGVAILKYHLVRPRRGDPQGRGLRAARRLHHGRLRGDRRSPDDPGQLDDRIVRRGRDPRGPVRTGEGPGSQARRPPRLRQARDPVRGPGGLLRAGRRGVRRR